MKEEMDFQEVIGRWNSECMDKEEANQGEKKAYEESHGVCVGIFR